MDDGAENRTGASPLAELEAMKSAHDAIAALEPDAQARVIQWVMGALRVSESVLSYHGCKLNTDTRATGNFEDDRARGPISNADGYSAFADLLGDAQPQTDAEKALVGGYWFQVTNGAEDFSSQSVNDKLKDTGEAIGNITRAFDRLKAAKPQLVRQLQKAGKTQQARKKLKLTTAGIEQVERMLREER